jgi:hypothetical protein
MNSCKKIFKKNHQFGRVNGGTKKKDQHEKKKKGLKEKYISLWC